MFSAWTATALIISRNELKVRYGRHILFIIWRSLYEYYVEHLHRLKDI
jgi:hypothetical protein